MPGSNCTHEIELGEKSGPEIEIWELSVDGT